MGFVFGNKIKVVLNAPLQDPIEYEIIGYKISLRREEADNIEVVGEDEAKDIVLRQHGELSIDASHSDDVEFIEQEMARAAAERNHIIRVALIGNPNCGKTSLFNIASGAHEHVGNYSGVTVDAKEGTFEYKGYTFTLVDLPGTYSISAYSPEELYVRKSLVEEMPDIVLNVVDSSNLARNLYLTTQVIDMDLRVVMALNMYDEFRKRGDKLDKEQLGRLLGIPIVPTVSKTGEGIDRLFDVLIHVYERKQPSLCRHIHINHGEELERSIRRIQRIIRQDEAIRHKYSTRFLAIKYLERDKDIEHIVEALPCREGGHRHALRRAKAHRPAAGHPAGLRHRGRQICLHPRRAEGNLRAGHSRRPAPTERYRQDRPLRHQPLAGFPPVLFPSLPHLPRHVHPWRISHGVD